MNEKRFFIDKIDTNQYGCNYRIVAEKKKRSSGG